jgi:hypothetical protein
MRLNQPGGPPSGQKLISGKLKAWTTAGNVITSSMALIKTGDLLIGLFYPEDALKAK